MFRTSFPNCYIHLVFLGAPGGEGTTGSELSCVHGWRAAHGHYWDRQKVIHIQESKERGETARREGRKGDDKCRWHSFTAPTLEQE